MRAALIIALCGALLASGASAQGTGPGSNPSNAVGVWGVNSSGAPCLIAQQGATGAPTCGLPPAPGGTPTVAGNQSNAAGGTTSALNVPTNSYTYYWNGSSWGQWTGNVGISGTLPAFAATPTFNCGTGCYPVTQPVSGTVSTIPAIGQAANLKVVTGSFPLTAGTYALFNNMGGLQTVAPSGVTAGQKCMLVNFAATEDATTNTTGPTIDAEWFSFAPTTTFTDGSTPTFNTVDRGNMAWAVALTPVTAAAAPIVYSPSVVYPRPMTADASGHFFFVLYAGSANALTSATFGYMAVFSC